MKKAIKEYDNHLPYSFKQSFNGMIIRGISSQEEHTTRKYELQNELDFYEALDGTIYNGETLENGSLFIAIAISPGFLENLILTYIPFTMANDLLVQFMVLLWCITASLYARSSAQ